MQSNIQSPGVYVNELNAFPSSVVAVPTAVPAFIGYTPQAADGGASYLNTPRKITSLAEFTAIFCYPDSPATKQYNPQYYLAQQQSQPAKGDYILIDGAYYSILPDPNTIYYLYNSLRLFYENGGVDAYIVSVGSYGPPSETPTTPGSQIINPNVRLTDLLNGLKLLLNEAAPTMYICPDATLLPVNENATLMQAMLLQSSSMRTSISIFDVIGGNMPDPILYTQDIEQFRNSTGETGLGYGAAYYPFVGTSIVQSSEIDYTNLFGGDISRLEPLINPANNPNPEVAAIIAEIKNPPAAALTVAEYNNALQAASSIYCQLMELVLANANTLPSSGAMAGIITDVDNKNGVWTAPANVPVIGAVSLPIYLTDAQQSPLNIDASGKSINAIRDMPHKGIVVWGSRTLDGNNSEWQYVAVRRTMTMIEQSCTLAVQQYLFMPNDKNTWQSIKSIITSFLTNLWNEGALMGASVQQSFYVKCGLNETMTENDVLNRLLIVEIGAVMIRPNEFIIIRFSQQQVV